MPRDYEVFVGKTYKGEIDFGAFKPISDASPKYVLSMDKLDFSRDGISATTFDGINLPRFAPIWHFRYIFNKIDGNFKPRKSCQNTAN